MTGSGQSQRTIASDSAETLFLRVWLYLAGFGASVLISRGLGPEGRGEYYLPVVAAGTMVAFCKLGLEQANVFLLGTRGVARHRLSGQAGLVASAMGSLGLILLLLAPSALPWLFAGTPMLLLLLAGLAIPFSMHTQFVAGLLTLQGLVTWQFRASLAAGVGQLVLLLGLWLAGWFSVGGVLAVNLVAVAGAWGVTVWPLERRRPAWIQWDVPLLRETLGQSLVLHLGMVIYFLHFRLDMFMVSGMVGTAALGHYSLAVALAETVLLATDSLALAVLPRQIGGSLEAAASLALKGARANALVASGLGLLWAATGAMVIRGFFGSAFAPAYGPLVALLPGIVFLSLERLCGGPTLRTGRRTRITLIYAGAFLCNVVLNLWWIPAWGILGAALASSVSYGVEALVILGWTARLAGVPLSQGIVPRRSDWADLWRAGVQATHLLQDAYLARKQVP